MCPHAWLVGWLESAAFDWTQCTRYLNVLLARLTVPATCIAWYEDQVRLAVTHPLGCVPLHSSTGARRCCNRHRRSSHCLLSSQPVVWLKTQQTLLFTSKQTSQTVPESYSRAVSLDVCCCRSNPSYACRSKANISLSKSLLCSCMTPDMISDVYCERKACADLAVGYKQ